MKILITAGPTREYFDTIRFVSNPSSGKMGYALAAAAAARGHDVTLVSGPVSIPPPAGVRTVLVISGAEMAAAVKAAWPAQDAAIMAAAVCDYRPARQLPKKMPKSNKPLVLRLLATEDILRSCGAAKRPGQVLVGIALEDHDGRAHTEAKLQRKNCDAFVLNGPANIGSDLADVEVLVAGQGWTPWRRASKERVAARLIRLVEALRSNAGSAPHTSQSGKPQRRHSDRD